MDALARVGAGEPEVFAEAFEAARHGLRRPRVSVSISPRDQVYDVTARPLYDGPRVDRVVVTARDMTELDRSQRAVRESRALMQTVLDTLEASIAVVDEEGVIVTHNQAWARVRGRGFPGVAAGQGASLLNALDAERDAGEGPSTVATFLRKVLEGDSGPSTCSFAVTQGDETRFLETSAVRLDHGGQELTVVIQNDVTSVRQAEQQRLDVQAKLLDADKAESLGVLAGGVAHDFNNLLVGILSNASFVLEQTAEDSVERDSLRDVELAAERAAELCEQLLAFSGRGQFLVDNHHLDIIVRESIRLLQASIPRTVSLDVVLPEHSMPSIRADVSQLRQVLFNLVTNAAEAIPNSGTVRVIVGQESLDEARLQQSVHGDQTHPGGHVFIRVIDDGSGMPDDVRARIFDPFFTTKFTGRGLGLAAVKGIVQTHRGVLEVDSTEGKGTTITAYFPLIEEAVNSEAPPRKPAVLVIDDEAFVRSAATRALTHAGFEVVEAESGEAGLDHFEAESGRFVLILLDVTMPGLSGEDVYTQLRSRSRSVPVLFSSGLPDITERGVFSRESRTFFIQKPYKSRDLITRVSAIIDQLGTSEGSTSV